VNLAVTFARLGLRVGLLDADIHGPSVAHMLGSSDRPEPAGDGQRVRPLERYGVRYLSLANVATPDAPIIWRGPMVASAIQQLLGAVEWGDLDLLLIDLPPGTGDAILAAGQSIALSGVIVVTTPGELSLADTRRGVRAFEALHVPALGLVENLAAFVCDCGDVAHLFGPSRGKESAEALGIPFLGRIPIVPALREGGDAGEPAAPADPGGPAGHAFEAIARGALARLALAGRAGGAFDLDWRKLDSPVPEPPRIHEAPDHAPAAVWQAADDVLGIVWGDGRRTFHGARELRLACPCARCVEEWTGEKTESLARVPSDVRPVTIRSVGRYALQPVWSDGHRTGIFSFEDLRAGAGSVTAPS
jgi:ATP-binding protein involved in chromosome partitioning